MASEIELSGATRGGPELRLLDRRAFIGFPPLVLSEGVVISDFALQIPDVTFPFNVTGGAVRFQKNSLLFGLLEISIDAEVLSRALASARLPDFDGLKLRFRPGYLEGQARLKAHGRAPLTFKVAFDGEGEKLAVFVYDVRMYGYCPLPSAQIPALLSKAVREAAVLPDVEVRGANGFSCRLLPKLSQLAAVSRGFKVPKLQNAYLSSTEVGPAGVRLRFAAGGALPAPHFDEALLLTLEGARAFAEAESLVASAKWADAKSAYLRLGEAHEAHPFAVERLLSLLVADPPAHDLALDVAESLHRRRPESAAALWAEAVVREHRGESARAAERFLALSALARKSGDDTSAFFAAEAAARAADDEAPQLAVRALHEMLGVRPDHLPSLRTLARTSLLASDRMGAIRALRRLAALSREPAEAAEAHVQLSLLCADTEGDMASARLHCEAALRLFPDHPQALLQMASLCHRSKEHLRALKTADRLREVALGRHEIARVAQAHLLAGRIWEEGLSQLDNALLRYREAASLLPGEAEPLFRAASVAQALGQWQEALAGFQQVIERLGPAPQSAAHQQWAHASHRALARLAKDKLKDESRARLHLEAALSLSPRDAEAQRALIPNFRATGRMAELAASCEQLAELSQDSAEKARLWAEAGEAQRKFLGNFAAAESLLERAVQADEKCKVAWEGLLAIAETNRDGPRLCKSLKALSQLADAPSAKADFLRRLAASAREVQFDFDLAAWALQELSLLEPGDVGSLGDLAALQRRRADMAALADVLSRKAKAAQAKGELSASAAAFRELAHVLESRLGRGAEALEALESAVRLWPDAAALLDLAELAARLQLPERARGALSAAEVEVDKLPLGEERAYWAARLAQAFDARGELEAASRRYAEAFAHRRLDDALFKRLEEITSERNPAGLPPLWALRAQALLSAGRLSEASPLLLKSAERYLLEGRSAEALTALHEALALLGEGPGAQVVLQRLAELAKAANDRAGVVEYLARQARLLPEGRESAALFFEAAGWASDEERKQLLLMSALERDPSYAPAHVERAKLLEASSPGAALDEWEAAFASSEEPAFTQSIDWAEAARRAARCAESRGDSEAARRNWARYLERADDDEVALKLAELHRRKKDIPALRKLLASRRTLQPSRELAELLLEADLRAEAKQVLQKLFTENSSDAWAARALYGLLPEPGRGAAEESAFARKLLDVLIPLSPSQSQAELLLHRARLLHGAKELNAARADVSRALQLSASAEALLWAAQLAHEASDAEAEVAALKSAAGLDAPLPTASVERLLSIAQSATLERKWSLAADAFAIAAPAAPSADARHVAFAALAESCLHLGDKARAAEAWQSAAQQGPKPERLAAHLARAGLLEEAGDFAGAEASLEAALLLSPRHPEATQALKRVLTAAEDWVGMSEVMAAEAASAPKQQGADLFFELGKLYLEKLSERTKARNAFARAVQLHKGHAEARLQWAALLFNEGAPEDACEQLEVATAEMAPSRAAAILWSGGEKALAAGFEEGALRLFRKALSAGGDGPQAEPLLQLLYLRGAVREAAPLAKSRAARASFEDDAESAVSALLCWADIAQQVGFLEEAEAALEKILSQRPLCVPAAQRLSALLAPHAPRKALEVLWAQYQQLSPSHRTVALLSELSQRVADELVDVPWAKAILKRAAELSSEPATERRKLIALCRAHGQLQEACEEWLALARAEEEAQRFEGAREAFEELGRAGEETGQWDGALWAYSEARRLSEKVNRPEDGAVSERRRARIFAEEKQDFAQAEGALTQSFLLAANKVTAELGAFYAARWGRPELEEKWLLSKAEKCEGREAAAVHLRLAELYEGPLRDADKAEAAWGRAISAESAILEADPLSERADRYLRYLERRGDFQSMASLQRRRAEATADAEASAARFLEAADAFRRAGDSQKAQKCEDDAFAKSPASEAAYQRLRQRAEGNVRELCELLSRRAMALPAAQAFPLLKERAEWLLASGERVLAAFALDDVLAVAPNDVWALSARAELAAESGGGAASQPYDRRLLSLAPDAERPAVLLRLAHAALESEAFSDAIGYLEEAVEKHGESPSGKQALSLLAEAYGRASHPQGVSRTYLRLAQSASGEEAAALYRRAADTAPDGEGALAALLPLFRMRPSDESLLEKAAAHLSALGRASELVELYESGAAAAQGGPRGAELWWRAARAARENLGDAKRSAKLLRASVEAHPHPPAMTAWAAEQKSRGDALGALSTLTRLLEVSSADDAPAVRMDLAEAALAAGKKDIAERELWTLAQDGPASKRREALDTLEVLYENLGNFEGKAKALVARARGETGPGQAAYFLQAAEAFERAGRNDDALLCIHSAASANDSVKARLAWGALSARMGALDEAADEFLKAARMEKSAEPVARAAEVYVNAGKPERAGEVWEAFAAEFPRLVTPKQLSSELLSLGQTEKAFRAGFEEAMAAAEFEWAAQLADAASRPDAALTAMWALFTSGPTPGAAGLLLSALKQAKDGAGLARLAEACQLSFPEVALSLWQDIALGDYDEGVRARAVQRLSELGGAEDAVLLALGQLPAAPGETVQAMLEKLAPSRRAELCQKLASSPSGSARMLREEALSRMRRDGQFSELASSLAYLAEAEGDRGVQSRWYEEMGDLYSGPLASPEKARAAYESSFAAFGANDAAATKFWSLAKDSLDFAACAALAERLAGSPDGARHAAHFWMKWLAYRQNSGEGRAWALLADWLASSGKSRAAALCNGFAAVLLEKAEAPEPDVPVSALRERRPPPSFWERPPDSVALTPSAMPRLFSVLSEAMAGFGAPNLSLWLHMPGGAEAYLLSETEFLLGGGALSLFGPREITFLCGVALAMGQEGKALAQPGAAPGLPLAAAATFDAYPCAAAALRVIGHLDDSVRGAQPSSIDVPTVLKQSPAFWLVAQRALALVLTDAG